MEDYVGQAKSGVLKIWKQAIMFPEIDWDCWGRESDEYRPGQVIRQSPTLVRPMQFDYNAELSWQWPKEVTRCPCLTFGSMQFTYANVVLTWSMGISSRIERVVGRSGHFDSKADLVTSQSPAAGQINWSQVHENHSLRDRSNDTPSSSSSSSSSSSRVAQNSSSSEKIADGTSSASDGWLINHPF